MLTMVAACATATTSKTTGKEQTTIEVIPPEGAPSAPPWTEAQKDGPACDTDKPLKLQWWAVIHVDTEDGSIVLKNEERGEQEPVAIPVYAAKIIDSYTKRDDRVSTFILSAQVYRAERAAFCIAQLAMSGQ